MAARRHPSAPPRPGGVDALDRRIDWNDVTVRATAGLTRWLLGPGLLSLHALVFVVVGLGMLLWNVLTDPANLTVGQPLLRWGIVLAGHAAAVLIGWTIWRLVHPPARRPAYRPLQRPALAEGRRVALSAEPVWYPNATANGHLNGAANGSMNGASPNGSTNGHSSNGATNGHVPHPAGAWPAQGPSQTVVTSRRVTTMVVATARDGFASARRRYRRDQPPAQPQPNGAHPAQPWAGPAPAQSPNGSLPTSNGHVPTPTPDAQPTSSWAAAVSRDEVISVTQADPGTAGEDHGTDPVRSWLDGYLDGKGREREARWTWVEAAASTWLARGEASEHDALPAPADPTAADRPAAAGAPPAAHPPDEPADRVTADGPHPPSPAHGDPAVPG